MLFNDWKNIYDVIPESEWKERWPNFTPKELSCGKGECPYCGGEYWHDEYSLDLLQNARTIRGEPLHITSAHRCPEWNEKVGGAKQSEHLRIAFDISLRNHAKEELLSALFEAGFTTFGMYNTFVHTDKRPWRKWIVSTGVFKQMWRAIYDKIVKGDD